jgi:hypothetical protein
MEIKYLSSLEEFAEPHVRQFFRSKNYHRNRLLESFGMSIGVAGGLVFFVYIATKTIIPVILLSPALALAAYHYYRFPSIIRKRIANHIKRDFGKNFECETSYTIKKNKIIIKSLETEIRLPLENLCEVKQDEFYLELWFGQKGICVIPLRVFNTDLELDEFIKEIKTA